MKVYVDELPKDCALCPFWARYVDPDYDELFYCKFDDSEENLDYLKHDEKNCPLQSLADYTKQVRKEVIEKVYKVLEQAIPHDLCWSWAVIKKELDKLKD